MSADVLSSKFGSAVPNKSALTHLVGRPLVPFFDGDADQTTPNYDANDFAVPEHLKLASRKFVNGYWVNEDGSTAQIGENTPTLINANPNPNTNANAESNKSPQRTSSHPTHKSMHTPNNTKTQRGGKHGKKGHEPSHIKTDNNANAQNSDALAASAPVLPARSQSETKVPVTSQHGQKSNKYPKSAQSSGSSPGLSSSTPSLTYSAVVANFSSHSQTQQNSSSFSNNSETDTFQTPFRSKKHSNANGANTNNAAQKGGNNANGTNKNEINKENFASLSSPAPMNIPMPKFLNSSSPPSKSPPTSGSIAADLTSLTLNSPVAKDSVSTAATSASVASIMSTTSSSLTVVENAEKGAELLNLLKKGLVSNSDTANAPHTHANAYPSHYSYTYPYPSHNPSAAPYPYAAPGYHPSYSAMVAHPAHYPMQPSTAASLSAATSFPAAAANPPSLMLLSNDGHTSGDNSVKSLTNNTANANTSGMPMSSPIYSFPLSHVHPYSSTAYHPHGHAHSLSTMHFAHPSVYTHFSLPHAVPSASSATLSSTSALGGQQHHQTYGAPIAAPSH